ncbi:MULTISPECIES: TIGR04283 family arsenosugar biosynthesis glycosyltransferase [Caldimonas]|uniref:TIGR04283 family arsenosugar biosynthesis glycosyltransferase n=1 Tax=Caldimonas TaxID=196013 RepID=UPI000361F5D7|nr:MULTISPECIES: TIGR04283 family arsenosugar biosynthesis glycosyltransferase [Caldimonas]GIX23549.1 MAG: glycosyl transferase [Caldimonas sp.]
MRLSVIVPMLNEAEQLPALLEQLQGLLRQGHEVILVDGGSHDGSAALARAAGLVVLEAARGRAMQMNAGAAQARGEVLLFLHADTRLPARATTAIEQALSSGRCVWGRFDVRIEGHSRWLPVVAWCMNLRSRLSGIATGDQAIFVTRTAFERVGGYPQQALMEDIELSRRLKALSAPACVRAKATTSGRRWEQRGVWRTIVLMWWLRARYFFGASPEALARAYR